MGFSISPDDVAKYIPILRSLPLGWQLVIALGMVAIIFALLGWWLAGQFYRERMETQRILIEEYREKLKGLSPGEASEQIQKLEASIVALQKQQWRRITSTQRTNFLETLQNAATLRVTMVEVFVVSGDAEAESYAQQLWKLLRECAVPTGLSAIHRDRESIELDKFGLVVLVKDVKALQSNAQWLVRGLKYSDIDHHVTSERVVATAKEDYLALRIGPRPE